MKQTWAVMVVLSWGSAVIAGSCPPPAPPWMPTDADDAAYADLLKRDAETYFIDVERYFRCLDQERREVFVQTREFSEEYARVLELLTVVEK